MFRQLTHPRLLSRQFSARAMSSLPPAPIFKPFNLALIQLGQIGADKAANLKHARDMVLKAAGGDGGAKQKPDLVVLPECFNSLYGHSQFPIYAETIAYTPGQPYDIASSQSESVKMLSSVAKEAGVWLIGGSIPERDSTDGKLYNTATVYSPQGQLVAMHRKVHLFDIDIPGKITFKVRFMLALTYVQFDEYDLRKVLHILSIDHLTLINVYRWAEFARIGLGICYDVRFPELAMINARRGCQVLIYPSAFNTTTGPLHWELLQRARAVDNQVYFAMCSPARDMTQGYHAWGHSLVVDPMGKILAEAEHDQDIVYAHIDPQTFNDARAGIPVTTQRRFDVYPDTPFMGAYVGDERLFEDTAEENSGGFYDVPITAFICAKPLTHSLPLTLLILLFLLLPYPSPFISLTPHIHYVHPCSPPRHSKYYDLLEVPPNASEADLKKAYRKKALRLHPDKGGDPELFKELTHAYEVLSDSQKRNIYDARGEAGLSSPAWRHGSTSASLFIYLFVLALIFHQDLFSQLFGGGGFGGSSFFGGCSRSPGPRKTKDLVHRVHVTLEDLYKGKTTKLSLTRNVICSKCQGRGGKEGAVKTCEGCGGRGVKVTMRHMGPMIQQLQSQCEECNGLGEIINQKDRCKTCNGKKVVSEKKMLEVHIDKGMRGGQTINFRGESDQAPGVTPGDVVIVIEEKPHERFKRQENDLFCEQEVDLLTALGGGQFAIKHLDDRALIVKLAPGEVLKHDDLKVIHGQGMPSQRHHEPGDLFVLPPRTPIEKFPKNVVLEEVELGEVDPHQRERANGAEPMDEDEGEGEPRMQCANQ
ncbi:Mitochondrial protein import protein mas5 [Grifola frondosa]|uniref:Mitochondrial protein import protein mas5 n=1 Tax=Grifola frondosa TaxID=5627 RepID=A0A1C7MJT1_GRIFR|nr:Mitochondrial protein import protein mas5 [Grifola frondosa]